MGRSFRFECSRCSYQACVSGGPDQGNHCFVETYECLSCRQLFDAVTHVRLLDQSRARPLGNLRRTIVAGFSHHPLPRHTHCSEIPATISSNMHRQLLPGATSAPWVEMNVQCPQSARHQIRPWKHPGRCPLCGTFLERTLLPFLTWE